jgi:broad specificity phosphatase PhoE
MGTLHLVRHGQASFGAADYDQLSPLGERQCERLGAYWRERGIRFDAVLTGTLRRHRQSWAAIARGLAPPGQAVELRTLEWPGLNEYDAEAVVRAAHPGPLPVPQSADDVRQHFRLLRDGLLAWMEARTQPAGMPPHAEFVAGVVGALDHVRAHHVGQRVLVVSSGGPIAHAVGQVLAVPPASVVELNLRIRNSSITELAFSASKHSLATFNTLPHLDHPDLGDWVTFA